MVCKAIVKNFVTQMSRCVVSCSFSLQFWSLQSWFLRCDLVLIDVCAAHSECWCRACPLAEGEYRNCCYSGVIFTVLRGADRCCFYSIFFLVAPASFAHCLYSIVPCAFQVLQCKTHIPRIQPSRIWGKCFEGVFLKIILKGRMGCSSSITGCR